MYLFVYIFRSKTLDNFPSRWLNFTMKYSEVTYDYTNKFVGYFVDFYKKQWFDIYIYAMFMHRHVMCMYV